MNKINQISISKKGPAKVLKLIQIEFNPEPGPDEVTIAVHFAGLNFADILMRQGFYPEAPKLPFTPGYEVSGRILALGTQVKNLKVGMAVIAGTKFGGLSEKIKVPAWQVLPLPADWTMEEGAGFPVAGITNSFAIMTQGGLKEKDKVLIDCATGGLGQQALQIFQKMHCETIALTSSIQKFDDIKKWHAQPMTHDQFYLSEQKNFKLIINSLGGVSIKKQMKRLSPGGKIVCLGVASAIRPGSGQIFQMLKNLWQMPWIHPVYLMNSNQGILGVNALKLFDYPQLARGCMENALNFNIKPQIGKIFDYKEAPAAHSFLENRQGVGKILLDFTSLQQTFESF